MRVYLISCRALQGKQLFEGRRERSAGSSLLSSAEELPHPFERRRLQGSFFSWRGGDGHSK